MPVNLYELRSSALNQKLATQKTPVYNRAQQKQIEAWKAIRNDADHGRFEDVELAKVEAMLSGVRQFIAVHIG